jgi:hypothetical protein
VKQPIELNMSFEEIFSPLGEGFSDAGLSLTTRTVSIGEGYFAAIGQQA